eukprot:366464-Chlamydomonas_euryale.AAC.1
MQQAAHCTLSMRQTARCAHMHALDTGSGAVSVWLRGSRPAAGRYRRPAALPTHSPCQRRALHRTTWEPCQRPATWRDCPAREIASRCVRQRSAQFGDRQQGGKT